MSQPQYEAYARDQLAKNLRRPDSASYYTADRIDAFVTQIEDRYNSEIISLRAQVTALKKENDLIWNKYVEDLANEKLLRRISEANNL